MLTYWMLTNESTSLKALKSQRTSFWNITSLPVLIIMLRLLQLIPTYDCHDWYLIERIALSATWLQCLACTSYMYCQLLNKRYHKGPSINDVTLRGAPRGGGVRGKNPGPPEGPRKTPRCLRARGLFLDAPGGPQGLLCPRASRTPGTSRPRPGAGPPGVPTCPGCRVIRAFSLTPPETPQDSWGPPGTGRGERRETASTG